MNRKDAARLVGSYGHGSLLPKDVAQAALEILEAVEGVVDGDELRWILDAESNLRQVLQSGREDLMSAEANDAFDLANSVLPDGFYAGAHPGDGADFGIWYDDDFNEED